MTFFCTKTYGHEAGFSCAFRQWRANSHCHFLHGYPLKFEFKFSAEKLDENGWTVDFGSMKDLKEKLGFWFDHTTAVAEDDPDLHTFFVQANEYGLIQLRVFPNGVGCEKFARHAWNLGHTWITEQGHYKRDVELVSVQVWEHSGNSAIWAP